MVYCAVVKLMTFFLWGFHAEVTENEDGTLNYSEKKKKKNDPKFKLLFLIYLQRLHESRKFDSDIQNRSKLTGTTQKTLKLLRGSHSTKSEVTIHFLCLFYNTWAIKSQSYMEV